MDLLEPLERQRTATLELLDSLDDEQLGAINAATGWTVRQLLMHVARSELGEAFFVRQARDGQLIDMSLDSRDEFNADTVAASDGWSLAQLREEFDDARESLRDAFSGLTDLNTPITWPEWPARTIGTSIEYMLGHESDHVAQVRAALGQ